MSWKVPTKILVLHIIFPTKMSFEQKSYFEECLDLGTGVGPLTTTLQRSETLLNQPYFPNVSGPFTSPSVAAKEHRTCKEPLSLRIPEPWEGLKDSSPRASTWKSCGVPLPSPRLTVPRTTPGTPELALGQLNTELALTDQDRELGLILHLLANASHKVKALLPSRKRIQPISCDIMEASAPTSPSSSPFANGKLEFGGTTEPQEQGRAMLRDYNLRPRIGKTQHTLGGMGMIPGAKQL